MAEQERKENPTVYKALNDSLQEHNLSWKDIESVVIVKDIGYDNQGIMVQEPQILTKEEAAEILRKSQLITNPREWLDGLKGTDLSIPTHISYGYELSENLPIYAYTYGRIFFIGVYDEGGVYSIESLPRNPSDKELPEIWA